MSVNGVVKGGILNLNDDAHAPGDEVEGLDDKLAAQLILSKRLAVDADTLKRLVAAELLPPPRSANKSAKAAAAKQQAAAAAKPKKTEAAA